MSWKDLEHFLVDLSNNAQLQKQYQAEPDAVMDGYGLSPGEKDLVKSKDKEAIKRYLADNYSAASKITAI